MLFRSGLTVERTASGPDGGDVQRAAEVADGDVDGVVFLRDPLTAQPPSRTCHAEFRTLTDDTDMALAPARTSERSFRWQASRRLDGAGPAAAQQLRRVPSYVMTWHSNPLTGPTTTSASPPRSGASIRAPPLALDVRARGRALVLAPLLGRLADVVVGPVSGLLCHVIT